MQNAQRGMRLIVVRHDWRYDCLPSRFDLFCDALSGELIANVFTTSILNADSGAPCHACGRGAGFAAGCRA